MLEKLKQNHKFKRIFKACKINLKLLKRHSWDRWMKNSLINLVVSI